MRSATCKWRSSFYSFPKFQGLLFLGFDHVNSYECARDG